MPFGNTISRATELLDSVLHAHRGIDRWNTFEKVSADFVSGGGLLPMKGININSKPLEGTATIHLESTVIRPFGRTDYLMLFTPDRVAVETTSGAIVEERSNPRAAFAGHTVSTPWWRGLRARFPDRIASHSKAQDFYFGEDFLLRRHDYNLEIAGRSSRSVCIRHRRGRRISLPI
jgi:hypothetical protein